MFNPLSAQPPAFRMIFMLELWERFGFYTMQGILTLYFIRYLGCNDVEAYYIFGAFSALVYSMVVIGGYLGDKVLGTKRTLVLGLVVLALGYLALALFDKAHVYLALGLVCVGNGLFKANPANLLSKCYAAQDPRLHAGFTLYYMAINLGSIVALLAGPPIASHYGYMYAFMLSSIGLVMGLVNYAWQHHYVKHIQTIADKRQVAWWVWGLILLGLVLLTYFSAYLLQHVVFAKHILWSVIALVLVFYGLLMRKQSKVAAIKMAVALIIMVEAVLFFTLYQQMPTSLTLFAVHNVVPNFLGIPINPQSFQVLNPMWIVLASPLLAYFYTRLNKKGIAFTIPYKFALGMTMCAISFLLLYCARFFHSSGGQVSSWWFIFSYLFQSLGELLVSALGVAMVAELVPSSIAGFVMGVWFLTSAAAGFIGAAVASFTALPVHVNSGMESLFIYTQVFGYIGIVTLGVSIVMWLIAKYLNKAMCMQEC